MKKSESKRLSGSFKDFLAEPVRNGVYKEKEFHGRGQKIVNMGELFAYNFIADQEMKRVELNEKEVEKSLLQDGDLLFARRSLVLEGSGKCSLVTALSEPTTFESSIIRGRLNQDKADPRFFFYYFTSPKGRGSILAIASQTAVSGIKGSSLQEIEIDVPDLVEQKRIASVLATFDDLIENNTKRIKILEDMARLIYREWFVHFRFPDHEKVKIVDSGTELGEVPEGWEVKEIGDAVETLGGGTPSTTKEEFWQDGAINWYSPVDLTRTGSMFMRTSKKKITELGLDKSAARLFPAFSVMLTSRATVGEVAINTTLACTNQGFITCIPNEKVSMYQIYFWLEQMMPTIMNLATGATFKEITKGNFRKLPILLLPKNINDQLVKVMQPTFEMIRVLEEMNDLLKQTRDSLLPKLISGQLAVA